MGVLVIASTEMEIAPFREKFPDADCLISGVGSSSTIYRLTKKIQQKKIETILQCGIAGTFSDSFELGEDVVVKQDAFGDIGVFADEYFQTVFELGLSEANEHPFENGLLPNPYHESFVTNNRLANAVTVSMITDNQTLLNQVQKKFDADIETMEGAALHYICLLEQIPFLQIRGISNKVGERDKSKWKLKMAVESSNSCLMEIYESIQNNIR